MPLATRLRWLLVASEVFNAGLVVLPIETRSAPLGGVFGIFFFLMFPLPPRPEDLTKVFSFAFLGLGLGGFADSENVMLDDGRVFWV